MLCYHNRAILGYCGLRAIQLHRCTQYLLHEFIEYYFSELTSQFIKTNIVCRGVIPACGKRGAALPPVSPFYTHTKKNKKFGHKKREPLGSLILYYSSGPSSCVPCLLSLYFSILTPLLLRIVIVAIFSSPSSTLGHMR